MQTTLSNTDRTLLSAYLDGELADGDRSIAERLIQGSAEARDYLRDLRLLNKASIDAFPAVPVGVGLAGGAIASKLTAGAIKSAAVKGAAAKGFFSGAWGIASMATAVVAVATGVAVTLNQGVKARDIHGRWPLLR